MGVHAWVLAVWAAVSAVAGPAQAQAPVRPDIWIDADPACGLRGLADPDDCFALIYALRSFGPRIVGISVTFGNRPLDETWTSARWLKAVLERSDVTVPPLYRGAPDPYTAGMAGSQASHALVAELEKGPLTILALGPLTTVAMALSARPDLAGNVTEIVAVMGKRPGHLFHPAEGAKQGILWGHGPVFRDLNFCKDWAAAAFVLDRVARVRLIPYEAARHLTVDVTSLEVLGESDPVLGTLVRASRQWFAMWRDSIGRDDFIPFDLAAAAAIDQPEGLTCARLAMAIAEESALFGLPPNIKVLVIRDSRKVLRDQRLIGPLKIERDLPAQTYCTGLSTEFTDAAKAGLDLASGR